MTDIVSKLRTVGKFLSGEGTLDGYWFGDKRPDQRGAFWWRKSLPLNEAADEITALRERVARTMSDSQRLIWRDDVEGICRSPDMCFEYGDHARCGPCAIDQAKACGIATIQGLPNLPEVSRLQREAAALRATIATLEALLRRGAECPQSGWTIWQAEARAALTAAVGDGK